MKRVHVYVYNIDMMKFEILLVKEHDKDSWEVCGQTYLGAPSFGPEYSTLKASKITLLTAAKALECGKRVFISKAHEYSEVLPTDLVIEDVDSLIAKKRMALNDINSLMHQNILGVSVVDSFEYLQAYMELLAAGIFITDRNREDKYFEIIEAAQTNQEPPPLPENASFEDEQAHTEILAAWKESQKNLNTLEKYLNALDKIQKIFGVNKILQTAKTSVEEAKTEEEVSEAVKKYQEIVDAQYFTPFGASPKSVLVQPTSA